MKPITLKPHEIRRLQSAGEVLVVRAVKPQPCDCAKAYGGAGFAWSPKGVGSSWYAWNTTEATLAAHLPDHCPLGKPSDRLWVREVWYAERTHTRLAVDYRADGDEHYNWYDRGFKWLSPVVMPKEASRFTVETVEVKVKRALEITIPEMEQAGHDFGVFGGNIIHAEERWRNTCNNASDPYCWFALVKEVK